MDIGSPRFNLSKSDAKVLGKQAAVVGIAAAATFILQGVLPGVDTTNISGVGMATVICIVLNIVQQWASDTRNTPLPSSQQPPQIGQSGGSLPPSTKPPVKW